MKQFGGKRVLITAGAGGIGLAMARAFAAAGARVHVVDIDADALASLPKDIAATEADVADARAVDALFEKQSQQFGGIDVLINCAGIQGPTARIEDMDFDDWRRCVAVNLDATFLCCRRAAAMMKSAQAGGIINISSTAGWHGYPLRAPYAAAKWAVIGLSKSLAMELGEFGIRVNAICPGSVDGERMRRVIAAEAREKSLSEASIRDAYTDSCSLKTFIKADDIADMALFLASDAASKVTGQALNVDGHLESFGARVAQ